ncbi:hypothetical protein [Saccharothrix obliqua]|uniref:hypothetical protein n=1 Tax=Saccharothrix obliqua TaxID=2861747 RepID=UPI001C5CF62C|nr:hypothetical protein [Saccharothrix obliqua]MBW4715777.1 hypothetical protein [Saccharothrix obliqua]
MTDPDSRPQPDSAPHRPANPDADRTDPAPAAPTPTDPAQIGQAPIGQAPIGQAPADPAPIGQAPTEPTPSAAAPTADTAPGADRPTADAGPATPPFDPQALFNTLSLAEIEADIERVMNDKMTELDGMLAGLEELVVRLEGEITALETPPDDSPTP